MVIFLLTPNIHRHSKQKDPSPPRVQIFIPGWLERGDDSEYLSPPKCSFTGKVSQGDKCFPRLGKKGGGQVDFGDFFADPNPIPNTNTKHQNQNQTQYQTPKTKNQKAKNRNGPLTVSTTACVYDGNNDHYYTCVRRQETVISLW